MRLTVGALKEERLLVRDVVCKGHSRCWIDELDGGRLGALSLHLGGVEEGDAEHATHCANAPEDLRECDVPGEVADHYSSSGVQGGGLENVRLLVRLWGGRR